jgi:hypothetical protein
VEFTSGVKQVGEFLLNGWVIIVILDILKHAFKSPQIVMARHSATTFFKGELMAG